MTSKRLAGVASAGLLLAVMLALPGCNIGGGGDDGGGDAQLSLVRVEASKPQYEAVASSGGGAMSQAKDAADSADTCAGRGTFDGDKKCKDDNTAVSEGDGSGKTNPDGQLSKPTPHDDKTAEVPSPEAQACQEVLKDHKQMGASTCLHHATTALVFAGARSAITEPGRDSVISSLAGMAISYAIGALTGVGTLGLLAKIAWWLLIAGGIAAFLGLLHQAYEADSDRRHSQQDSKQHADAVWRESRLVAMLVLMLVSAGGKKAMEMLKAKAPVAPAAAEAAAAPAAAETAAAAKAAPKLITDPRRLLPAASDIITDPHRLLPASTSSGN